MNKKLLLLVTFFVCIAHIFARTCTSGNGTYASWLSAVWSCTAAPVGGPPVCSDNIVVNGTIRISQDVDYSGCSAPIVLTINGTMDFNTNGVRFKLPANSTVVVAPGGHINKSFAGGGSSTLISIGGSNVWTAGDGDVTGPVVYGAPLPIELLNFGASVCENSICLEWRTASELNNNYFEIQKTVDGIVYESIGRVNGAGNSSSVKDYSFTDNQPYDGMSYYRLKQVDYNGAFTFSDLAEADFKSSSDFSVEVYPNPNNGDNISLLVNGVKGEEILVVVTDITGKNTYSKVLINENNPQNVYAIDPSKKLPAGIYFITATSMQSIVNKKMIVSN